MSNSSQITTILKFVWALVKTFVNNLGCFQMDSKHDHRHNQTNYWLQMPSTLARTPKSRWRKDDAIATVFSYLFGIKCKSKTINPSNLCAAYRWIVWEHLCHLLTWALWDHIRNNYVKPEANVVVTVYTSAAARTLLIKSTNYTREIKKKITSPRLVWIT